MRRTTSDMSSLPTRTQSSTSLKDFTNEKSVNNNESKDKLPSLKLYRSDSKDSVCSTPLLSPARQNLNSTSDYSTDSRPGTPPQLTPHLRASTPPNSLALTKIMNNQNTVSAKITENPSYKLINGGVKFENGISNSVVKFEDETINGVKFEDEPNNGVTFEDGVKDEDSDTDSIYSSSHFSENEFDERNKKPKVPDGGWGWVVVLSSLIISTIADGISFSFGLLYVQFLNHFEESKSKTAWIGSLFMAVPLLSGPVGSALVDRYGCRWMTITGGIISGIGFMLSSFCNTIEMMYLTFGVIAGLGLGLCYVTAVVSIAYWFDKKRTLATGLGACGTGIGTFLYAPMTKYFIEEYGWRGTTLLLAGTFFNMCVCGAVMRDPEWWTLEQAKSTAGSLAGTKSVRAASSCGSISGRSEGGNADFPGVEEIRRLLKSGRTPEYILTALATYTGEEAKVEQEEEVPDGTKTPAYSSVVNLPTFIRQSETVPLEVLESLSANKRVFKVILENYPSLLLCRSISDKGKLHALTSPDAVLPHTRVPVVMSMKVTPQPKQQQQQISEKKKSPLPEPTTLPLLQDNGKAVAVKQTVTTPLTREALSSFKKQFCMAPAPHTHYLKGIRMHRNSVMYRGAMLNIHKYRLRASSCPDIYRNSMTTIAKETEEKWYSDILELLKGMVDFSMFRELHFLFLSLSTILLFIWFIVPYFYISDYLQERKLLQEEGSKLLSIIGVTNCIGMIVLGWAGDQPWMNVTKSYSIFLMMCGISTVFMPLVIDTYWALALLCALFGVFFASSFSFTPVILVQLIPIDRFTTGYGLVLLCQGIGNLIGPPLAGLARDLTGSWDLSFYLAGVWIFVSGLFILLISYTKNRIFIGKGTLAMDVDRESSSVA